MPDVPDKLEVTAHPTVLVAEDHDDTRFMLKVLLEQWGYRVVEAGDGFEAVESARRECPDIVLMDVSLPALDGLSATRMMREQESLRAVPVVAVSGHAAERDRTAALAAGCSAYLTKPIAFDRLDALLRHFVPAYKHAA
ncbi:MAG TPA: response regulator [Pyrinomonadaceae bacterium]|nr:response regulator [Pyrinomonadaceae bacterium]